MFEVDVKAGIPIIFDINELLGCWEYKPFNFCFFKCGPSIIKLEYPFETISMTFSFFC